MCFYAGVFKYLHTWIFNRIRKISSYCETCITHYNWCASSSITPSHFLKFYFIQKDLYKTRWWLCSCCLHFMKVSGIIHSHFLASFWSLLNGLQLFLISVSNVHLSQLEVWPFTNILSAEQDYQRMTVCVPPLKIPLDLIWIDTKVYFQDGWV